MWRIGLSDEARFRKVCKEITSNTELWKKFKQDPYYRRVIGYDDMVHAAKTLTTVRSVPEVFENMGRFQENDLIGGDMITRHGMSAAVARNAESVALLHKNFGDLNGKKVLEIGPGWGGLGHCLNVQWPNIQYFIQDLPEHAELAAKYLAELGVTNVTVNDTDVQPDILIAEYSLSEQDDETIGFYWNKYKNCEGFFFRWNTFATHRDNYWYTKFREDFNLAVETEHKYRFSNFIVIGKR